VFKGLEGELEYNIGKNMRTPSRTIEMNEQGQLERSGKVLFKCNKIKYRARCRGFIYKSRPPAFSLHVCAHPKALQGFSYHCSCVSALLEPAVFTCCTRTGNGATSPRGNLFYLCEELILILVVIRREQKAFRFAGCRTRKSQNTVRPQTRGIALKSRKP
jgi:hypothetical protein